MQTLIAARDWLTVIRLPSYAPDLNPAEGVWRWMKRGLTNLAARGVDHLADLVRQRLRTCQQQTELLAGFLANTGRRPRRHQPGRAPLDRERTLSAVFEDVFCR